MVGLVLQAYCFEHLVDTTSPIILNMTYDVLEAGLIMFNSHVVDNMAIEAVTFHYSQDGGSSWSNTPMTKSNLVYGASIEPSQEGIWIIFYVSASDASSNSVNSLTNEILVDTNPPKITHVQHTPNPPNDRDVVVVTAYVSDNLAVANVTLQYSTDRGLSWEPIPMQLSDGLYIGEIIPHPVGTNVTYFVSAIDIGGNLYDMESPRIIQYTVKKALLSEFIGVLISLAFTLGIILLFIRRKVN